jgi:hypothetical protein
MRSDLIILQLARKPGCTLSHLAVYAALHCRSTFKPGHPDYGWARASIARIASLTGFSARTISRCIKWLEAAQVLTVRRMRRADGRGEVNRYWLLGPSAPGPEPGAEAAMPRSKRRRHMPAVASGATCQMAPDPHAKSVQIHMPPGGTVFEIRDSEIKDFEIGTAAHNGAAGGASKSNGNGKRTWLSPYFDDWVSAYGGKPNAKQLAKDLAPQHEAQGEAWLRPRWQTYLLRTPARFASSSKFVQTIGAWDPSGTDLRAGTADARNALAIQQWRQQSGDHPSLSSQETLL